jgi:hypothetical protein
MHVRRSSGLGLIVLGILLLGAQLVLSLGAKTTKRMANESRPVPTSPAESHPAPVDGTTVIPGVFGLIALVSGIVVAATSGGSQSGDGCSVP